MSRASTGTGGAVGDSGADGSRLCAYGQIICDGDVAKVCDGEGAFAHVIRCNSACNDGQGCVTCVPNTGACDMTSGIATLCNATGSYTATFKCEAPNTCDPDGCHGVCAPSALGTSNVGCDFWSTVTANNVWTSDRDAGGAGLHFGVLLGNTSTKAATVTIAPARGRRRSYCSRAQCKRSSSIGCRASKGPIG